MLEASGITSIATSDVIALVQSADANGDFVLTRDEVYTAFDDLSVDWDTVDVIALNEAMYELGVADPVLDVTLVQAMLAEVGITDITDSVIQDALDAA